MGIDLVTYQREAWLRHVDRVVQKARLEAILNCIRLYGPEYFFE